MSMPQKLARAGAGGRLEVSAAKSRLERSPQRAGPRVRAPDYKCARIHIYIYIYRCIYIHICIHIYRIAIHTYTYINICRGRDILYMLVCIICLGLKRLCAGASEAI